MSAVGRHDSHGADTVLAEGEQDAEVIARFRSRFARLVASQPALGSEMLEKWQQSIAPIMVSLFRREGASNRLRPAFIIDEPGIPLVDFGENPAPFLPECDDGCPVCDCYLHKKLCTISLYAIKNKEIFI
nr:hypothetical protein [Parasphingopyxis algicola]